METDFPKRLSAGAEEVVDGENLCWEIVEVVEIDGDRLGMLLKKNLFDVVTEAEPVRVLRLRRVCSSSRRSVRFNSRVLDTRCSVGDVVKAGNGNARRCRRKDV